MRIAQKVTIILALVLTTLVLSTSYANTNTTTHTPYPIHWTAMTAGHTVPEDALEMGKTPKGSLYFCSARFKDGTQPGQWTKQGCLISYGGKTFLVKHFSVLTGKKAHITWEDNRGWQNTITPYGLLLPDLPQTHLSYSQPLLGGYETRYINYQHQAHITSIPLCRTIYNDTIHLGKVVGSSCNISAHHQEQISHTYQELYYQSDPNNKDTPLSNQQPPFLVGTIVK